MLAAATIAALIGRRGLAATPGTPLPESRKAAGESGPRGHVCRQSIRFGELVGVPRAFWERHLGFRLDV
jgi:hypothetical protein